MPGGYWRLLGMGELGSSSRENARGYSASTSAPATNPAQPTTPAVTPSAAVKQLQQELGQLNYYEGPVDGLMGPPPDRHHARRHAEGAGELPGPRQQPDGR
jgi:hypothetical protein